MLLKRKRGAMKLENRSARKYNCYFMKLIEDLGSVLVIDDDDIGNYLLQRLLNQKYPSLNVQIVENGKVATVLFDDFRQKNQFPELILLDINMPLMAGFDFLDWYEENGFSGSTKFAMYSTSIRAEERAKSFTYTDVVEFMEKPLDDGKLAEVIEKLALPNDP